MFLKIHHIGIAVKDLEASTGLFRDVLGMSLEGTDEVPSEKARVSFFPVGESSFELVQSLDPASGLSRFLEKRGPGIHHICVEVDDIEADMAALKARGVEFIQAAPTPGAHGARVAFIHPRSAGGILLELRQGPAGEETSHGE